jgi:hypothetical protein
MVAWTAPTELVASLLDPFARERRPMNQYTADLSDGFFVKMWAISARLGCHPLDLLRCWMNESGVRSTARNPRGNASGLFQLMPAIARGIGWDPKDLDLTRYRLLSPEEQLDWAARYYGPHAGKLVDSAACYLATFMPAFLAHASDPAWVMASTEIRADDYWANLSFDQKQPDGKRKGEIVVGDLTLAIERACQGPRWEEIAARLAAAQPAPAVDEPIENPLAGAPVAGLVIPGENEDGTDS